MVVSVRSFVTLTKNLSPFVTYTSCLNDADERKTDLIPGDDGAWKAKSLALDPRKGSTEECQYDIALPKNIWCNLHSCKAIWSDTTVGNSEINKDVLGSVTIN